MSAVNASNERQNRISSAIPSHLVNHSAYESTIIHRDTIHDRTAVRDTLDPYSNTSSDRPPIDEPNKSESHDYEHGVKRPRACDACRALKVRCDQDVDHSKKPCTRCLKANRRCVVTPLSRKRQRRSENKVVELEKKIDALTATLLSKRQPGAGSTNSTSPRSESSRAASPGEKSSGRLEHNDHYAKKRVIPSNSNYGDGTFQRVEKTVEHKKRKFGVSHPVEKGKNGNPCNINQQPSAGIDKVKSGSADLQNLVRSLIDIETEEKIFDRFVNFHLENLPVLVFPSGTKVSHIRETRPLLYLAIMVAAGTLQVSSTVINKLLQELKRRIAEDILIEGHKSIELIQALHITCFWYKPSSAFAKHTFYQLMNMAGSMAIELGLGRTGNRHRLLPSNMQDPYLHWVLPNPDSIECRRTWLVCYFCCTWAVLIIKRPILFRWSSYMDKCLEVLRSSPEATSKDEILCHYAELAHIWEDVSTQFAMDDPSAAISISDSKVLHQIKSFDNRLEEWRVSMPVDVDHTVFCLALHTTSLLIHEIALYVNHNVDDFKMPFHESSLRYPQPHIKIANADHLVSISTCITAAQSTLHSFFKLSHAQVLSLPMPFFVRVSYSILILIKINMAILMPESALGRIISRSELQIEDYLNRLIEVFERIMRDDSVGPSQPFMSFKRRWQSWLQGTKETALSKGQSDKIDLQERSHEADTVADDKTANNGRPIFQHNETTSTEEEAVACAINMSGRTGSITANSRMAFQVQATPVNRSDLYENGSLHNQSFQAQAPDQDPVLDTSLNFPLALNEFDFGSAFPMADFLFGGMDSFAEGLTFDGGGGGIDSGDVGSTQRYGLQGERVPFDYSQVKACSDFIP